MQLKQMSAGLMDAEKAWAFDLGWRQVEPIAELGRRGWGTDADALVVELEALPRPRRIRRNAEFARANALTLDVIDESAYPDFLNEDGECTDERYLDPDIADTAIAMAAAVVMFAWRLLLAKIGSFDVVSETAEPAEVERIETPLTPADDRPPGRLVTCSTRITNGPPCPSPAPLEWAQVGELAA